MKWEAYQSRGQKQVPVIDALDKNNTHAGLGWVGSGHIKGLILSLHIASERRRYFVTTSLTCWAQA